RCAPASTPDKKAGSESSSAAYTYAKRQSEVKDREQLTTDVMIVGGGGAGICAALSAAENGAQVILAEKLSQLGGATALSGGAIPVVGTKQQIDAGVEDSFFAMATDILRPTNYTVRADLVYAVAENAKSLIEWTEKKGVVWKLDERGRFGQTARRMHIAEGTGEGLIATLVDYMKTQDAITQILSFEVEGLVLDDADTVVGVYGTNDGKKCAVTAKSTILATSGFANNPDMIAQYCPETADAVKVVAMGATGESIQWAEELGVELQCMGAYQGHAFRGVDSNTTAGHQALATNGAIIVNKNGERFVNEYGGYSDLSPHVLAQPDHIGYLCFTDIQAAKSKEFAERQSAGHVAIGATAAELAAALGIDAPTLEKTFEAYKEGIAKGEDGFNRSKLPENFDAPYYAMKITGEIRHTQGGMPTDIEGHVIRPDESPIPGLYAAGGCTEGFSCRAGSVYSSGNGLIQALLFGMIAGKNAAAE
ncbi:MAG: FAD-binding protein, partial [Raoultibacter sp.]